MAHIGDTFITGQESPVNGDYKYLKHIEEENTPCIPTSEEMEITLGVGKNFPPHKSCRKGVVWQLIRFR